jgi:translocation and assembly module TamA
MRSKTIERPLIAVVLAALLLSTHPVLAQPRNTDAELEALIPDSAVDDPEAFARDAEPAAPQSVLDPESPLTEDVAITLPWPDQDLQLPALVNLEPDPDIETALKDLGESPKLATVDGDVIKVSSELELVFPADDALFPERTEFEQRFEKLSNVEKLSGEGEDNAAQLGVRARSDLQLLQKMLRIYGYYDAEVYQSVSGIDPGQTQAKTEPVVRFEIVPGKRFRFGKIDLATLEDAGADYPAFRAAFGIQTGDPLYSDKIVEEKTDLDTAMAEGGYPFAKLGDPDLLVDHARDEGDLTLAVTPGGKYTFGRINSELPKFLSSKHLEEIARFEPGDLYQRSLSDDLRRAILATGLVSSVSVAPREVRAPTATQPGEVTMDVGMTKAPLRTIAGALGYDTSEGPRAEVTWENRNMFPPEGRLQLRGVIGTKEQLLGANIRRNNFKGRDQVLTFDLYGSTIDRDAYEARTVALSASFEKLTTLIFQKEWTWSAGVQLLRTNEREGKVRNLPVNTPRETYYIGAIPLRGAYDGSDNLLDPTRGFRAALSVSPEVSFRQDGEKNFYARIQADASYYLPFGEDAKVVMAARARLGSIPGTAIDNIAPSRRFYAGGGGSVRGYGYQMIGPRDTVGDPSGGRSLSEFSLEARVKTGMFDGNLSVVPFVDAGAVDTGATPRLRDIRYGAGVGVRFKTGFGPLRLDLATPLNPHKGDSRIGVYIALGQAF